MHFDPRRYHPRLRDVVDQLFRMLDWAARVPSVEQRKAERGDGGFGHFVSTIRIVRTARARFANSI